MEGKEVETYFAALDEALANQPIKKPVRLVVVGGIYMVCFVKNRESTKDVDIVPLDFPDTMNPNQETKVFRSAVNAVAKKYGIKRDWMNDVVASFTPELDPNAVILWHDYPNLQVYVPQAECILALKLLAGRERDEDDIVALSESLNVTTREQAQDLVDRYAEKWWQKECNLEATLDALF
ncbi:MAG: DUF6036 family nucleotidyltransferase [Ktedonobacteraceae bacterium]